MENIELLVAILQVAASIATVITIFFLIQQLRNQIYSTFVQGALEIDCIMISYPEYRKYVFFKYPWDWV